jgi:hypothetical protein
MPTRYLELAYHYDGFVGSADTRSEGHGMPKCPIARAEMQGFHFCVLPVGGVHLPDRAANSCHRPRIYGDGWHLEPWIL